MMKPIMKVRAAIPRLIASISDALLLNLMPFAIGSLGRCGQGVGMWS